MTRKHITAVGEEGEEKKTMKDKKERSHLQEEKQVCSVAEAGVLY